MPKTRVFISSTCYDLSQVRADLENFIHTMNYESVRNEKGNIPYSTNQELEKYCYKEISACEIVLHIIGGRFGSFVIGHQSRRLTRSFYTQFEK